MLKLMRRLAREQRGITGLETAIILIAFVVVAAVFAYTALSAGIFSAQKGQETIYGGLKQAAGSMELKGGMVAYNTVTTENIGTGDGTATTFYTQYAPLTSAGNEKVYDNGTLKTGGGTDYTITASTGTIVFNSAPTLGHTLTATYTAASSKVAEVTFVVGNGVGGETIDLTAPSAPSGAPTGQPSGSSTHKAVIAYHDKSQYINNLIWTESQLGFGNSDSMLNPGEEFLISVPLKALTTKLGTDTEFTLEFKPMGGGTLVLTRTTPSKIDAVMNLR